MGDLLRHIGFDDRNGLWLTGLRIQIRVIGALMLRDAVAQFGHENLGFFWIVGEPILLTCGVMALWTFTGATHGGEGVGVVPFALTGYSYITMWRHLVSRANRGLTRNAPLFFLTQIKYFDVLFAGALLEIIAILAAFLVVYIPLALLGYAPIGHDPLLSLCGWFLAGWFSFAFSLIIAGVSELSEPMERFIQPVMYITLPATGVFYMLDWLPAKGQKVLAWSPLVSGIEMFRGGIFPPDIPVHYDALYLFCWCLGLTAIGLPLCNYAQKHVQLV
jgi:capsular polysaccharide transport system permease protein